MVVHQLVAERGRGCPVNGFVVAAIAMLHRRSIPCGIVVCAGHGHGGRSSAYEAISSIVVMVLVLLAEGFGRFGEFELPVLLAVLLFGSGLVFVRCAGALAVIVREIVADVAARPGRG